MPLDDAERAELVEATRKTLEAEHRAQEAQRDAEIYKRAKAEIEQQELRAALGTLQEDMKRTREQLARVQGMMEARTGVSGQPATSISLGVGDVGATADSRR